MSGLSKFLEVPINYYSSKTGLSPFVDKGRRLRQVTSSAILGIIEGHGNTLFGEDKGWDILSDYLRIWAHYLSFMRAQDARLIIDKLKPGEFSYSSKRTLYPLLQSFDKLAFESSGAFVSLPVLGQYLHHHRKFEVALRPPADVDNSKLRGC
jgi:hypothetical protein